MKDKELETWRAFNRKQPLKAYRHVIRGKWEEIPMESATQRDCISVANPITPGFARGCHEAVYGIRK